MIEMMRAWVVCCALFIGCGEVVKVTPDAAKMPDAAIDAVACTGTPPDATFQVNSPAPINTAVAFTPTATGLAYAWTFASGTPETSTAETPSVTWSAVGSYSVSLTVTDNATSCSATSMQTVMVAACAAPLSSPAAFTGTTSGHADSGIILTPTVNTTLTSFKVMNQMKADTIKLMDMNNTVLQSTALPAAMNPYVATVAWPLTANVKYKLVTADAANNLYANIAAAGYPVQSASLSIPAGYMDGQDQSSYWFGFTEIVTCP